MDSLKQMLVDARDTIIKLQSELDEKDRELIKIVSEQKALSKEVMSAHKKRDALELSLEQTQNNLKKCLVQLEECERAAEESRRAASNLAKKRDVQESLLSELENKVLEVSEAAKVEQNKFTEAMHKLREIEEKNDQMESLIEKKQKTLFELHKLSVLYSNKLKSFETSAESANSSVECIEKEIKEVLEKLNAANQRAKDAEQNAHLNQLELARLEDELADWKDKNTCLRSEIERISVELE